MLGLISLIFIAIILCFIFIKVYCANKNLISILLMSIEITLAGIGFLILGSKESYGNDGFIYSFIGLTIVIFGLFVGLAGFRKNE